MPFITQSIKTGVSRIHVRAIISFIFTLALVGGFFMDKIPAGDFKEMAMITIVWYFSKRQADTDVKE